MNLDGSPIMPVVYLLTFFKLRDSARAWLSKPKVDVDCISQKRFTALWLACRLGFDDMVALLLEYNANPLREDSTRRFCLAGAAFYGHIQCVKSLLAYKPEDKIGEQMIRQQNWYGRSVLTDAAVSGHIEVVKTLLEHMKSMEDRADVIFHQAENGNAILHETVLHDAHGAIDFLLGLPEASALVGQHENRWGDSPAHRAVTLCRYKCLETLLKIDTKMQLDTKQRTGKTPLSVAVSNLADSHLRITELLLSLGSDPSIKDNDGMTALHYAAFCGRPRQVERLLKDQRCCELLDTKDNRVLTPLEIAWKDRRNDWGGVVRFLKEAEARGPGFIHSIRIGEQQFIFDHSDPVHLLSEKIPENVKLPIP